MKQADLKPCANCGKGVMHNNSPIFYRVSIDQMVVDVRAVERQHGMELMMGAAAPLASALGPNEDMAIPMQSKKDLLLCDDCALEWRISLIALLEMGK